MLKDDLPKKTLVSKRVVFCLLVVLISGGLYYFLRMYHQGRYSAELASAVTGNDAESVKRLLAAGADPDARKSERAPTGLLEFARTLFAHRNGSTAPTVLVIACQANGTEVAELLLAAGANVDPPVRSGQTPLGAAAANGNVDLVRLLLNKGAAVNRQESNGMTALIYGAPNDQVVHELLSHRADPSLKAQSGFSPVSSAMQAGNMKSLRLLVDAGATVRDVPILLVGTGGNLEPEFITYLIKHGADLRRHDLRGQTALFQASRPGSDASILKALLDAGAEVNVQDNQGRTPLMNAVGNIEYDGEPGNPDAVKLLLDRGSNPLLTDKNGHDTLWHATIGLRTGEPPSAERNKIVKLIQESIHRQRFGKVPGK